MNASRNMLIKYIYICSLLMVTAGCELTSNPDEPFEWGNPYCLEVTLDFRDSGSAWVADKIVPNVISESYDLVSISIIDATGEGFSNIRLFSPADDDGHVVSFNYPNSQGGKIYSGNSFSESSSGGTCTYTAENLPQRQYVTSTDTTMNILYSPPKKTLGHWTLEVERPSSSSSSMFSVDIKVCFKYDL